jgi:hypothetical protein
MHWCTVTPWHNTALAPVLVCFSNVPSVLVQVISSPVFLGCEGVRLRLSVAESVVVGQANAGQNR